jgi:protein gp37
MTTKIEWTDETWNPIVGCSKISTGCENCYAEQAAASARLQQFEQYQEVIDFEIDLEIGKDYGRVVGSRWNGKTTFVESALEKPLHWKKPRRIFVCSMGDLFHESVPFEWIDKVMAIIALCPQHTFQILTKRAGRMAEYFERSIDGIPWHPPRIAYEPRPNLWLGVTAENQKCANERIPLLLQTPAAVRFVSLEPLLGEIDLARVKAGSMCPDPTHKVDVLLGGYWSTNMGFVNHSDMPATIDWVIIGCESGPKRRECKIEWVRDIVEQCQTAEVPVFVKQLSINGKVSKNMDEWPEDLRVRDFPK